MNADVWPLVRDALLFLGVNVLILCLVLWRNRKQAGKSPPQVQVAPERPAQPQLDPADILGWEFEYARITASEAMQDRHTMVNFYLLAVGIVATGIVSTLGEKSSSLPRGTGTVLAWLLCAIGWFDFLSLIRLRQAWQESARAMNCIKEFCIQHAKDIEPVELRKAFLWKSNTVPPPDKPWTVFFYSATLIGFLDSVAFVVGIVLLHLNAFLSSTWLSWLVLFLGLCFFTFHVALYFAFLKPSAGKRQPNARSQN